MKFPVITIIPFLFWGQLAISLAAGMGDDYWKYYFTVEGLCHILLLVQLFFGVQPKWTGDILKVTSLLFFSVNGIGAASGLGYKEETWFIVLWVICLAIFTIVSLLELHLQYKPINKLINGFKKQWRGSR